MAEVSAQSMPHDRASRDPLGTLGRTERLGATIRAMRAAVLLLCATGCVSAPDPADEGPRPPPGAYLRDDELRVTDAQGKGTHNSYHVEPGAPIAASHRYTHARLAAQLGELGVRQLELDLHLRVGTGFEVFHLPLVDAETTCLALADCLAEIAAFSTARPFHAPLMVWLEPKDEDADAADPDLLPLLGRWEALEDALREGLGRERILGHRELRGDAEDVATGVRARGWPTMAQARGKVVLGLLDRGSRRADYVAWAEAAEDPLIHPTAESLDEPWAALAKLDDAAGDPRVGEFLAAGILVTSNAGTAGDAADAQAAEWAESLAAGAHFVATDFPDAAEGFGASVPGGAPLRCNPVAAPSWCAADDIEVLGGAPAE